MKTKHSLAAGADISQLFRSTKRKHSKFESIEAEQAASSAKSGSLPFALFSKPASTFLSFMFALAVLAVGWVAEVKGEDSASSATKKNVIILLADDLGWGDVGFHGGSAETPNLDQFAKEGVELTRFYAYPACSPSRAAMLTGRFPQRYGITGPVRQRDPGLPVAEEILPAAFQSAGYQTSLIGKWHLGYSSNPLSHPLGRGFNHFYGFMSASIDYYEHTSRGELDWQRNAKPVQEKGYATDLLADDTIKQIKNRDKSKPFCVLVSLNAPHTPLQAPDNLIAKYTKIGGFNERGAIYAAMIESMDTSIGRILNAIDEEKLRDDTVVIFASDNGAARVGSNKPFHGQKRQVYEGGIHVPCVIRLPNVLPAGTKSNQLAKIDDLFPTLAGAVGLKLPDTKPLDGHNLWSQLVKGTTKSRSIVIAESAHTIIRDNWKLISPASGKPELYNLETDSVESKNVYKQQSKIGSQLVNALANFKQQVAADRPSSFAFGRRSK